jgi:cell division protein FtsZ
MQGEIRVTVIATGFDRQLGQGTAQPAQDTHAAPAVAGKGAPVIPFPIHNRPSRVSGMSSPPPAANNPRGIDIARNRPVVERGSQDLSDMEIPTFIRRQMD